MINYFQLGDDHDYDDDDNDPNYFTDSSDVKDELYTLHQPVQMYFY